MKLWPDLVASSDEKVDESSTRQKLAWAAPSKFTGGQINGIPASPWQEKKKIWPSTREVSPPWPFKNFYLYIDKKKIRLSTREDVTSWLFMNFPRPGSPSRDPHGAALSRLSTNQHTLSPSKDSNFTERERVSNYMCPTLIVMSWFFSLIHSNSKGQKYWGQDFIFTLWQQMMV